MININNYKCKCGYFKMNKKEHCCFNCSINQKHGCLCDKVDNFKDYISRNYCCLINFQDKTKHGPSCNILKQTDILPAIVCIAKGEINYIEEFVIYHLSIGFTHIYIYDNEDQPIYKEKLDKYKNNITVIHFPTVIKNINIQMNALDNFIQNYINNRDITHIIHMDIDEYIVLKKHKDIIDFIKDYIVSCYNIYNNCGGIAINWKFFGSKINENFDSMIKKHDIIPTNNVLRFTNCDKKGHGLMKTLFNKEAFINFANPHIIISKNNLNIKNVNGKIINNLTVDMKYRASLDCIIDTSIIQINHYKCKTIEEYKKIRLRGRADGIACDYSKIHNEFKTYDVNRDQDLTAYNYYLKNILNIQ